MKRTNWKQIAITLAKDVNFALGNLRPVKGFPSGIIMSRTGVGKTRHWKDRFADSLELLPGVTVDREAMHKDS